MNFDRIGGYVRSRQTSDGGFFFARVPPGTTSDTYHALGALRLLGREAGDPEAARTWILERGRDEYLANPRAIYHLISAAALLNVPRELRQSWAARVWRFENHLGGYGTLEHFDLEVTSELETTAFAVAALRDAGLEFDGQAIARFLERHRNSDGGFGSGARSTLPSTYFALATLEHAGLLQQTEEDVLRWLRRCEAEGDIPYLEDVRWLVSSLRLLGEEPSHPERWRAFVGACQLPSGGFARTIFGIATLEYTHYALQSLAGLDARPPACQ